MSRDSFVPPPPPPPPPPGASGVAAKTKHATVIVGPPRTPDARTATATIPAKPKPVIDPTTVKLTNSKVRPLSPDLGDKAQAAAGRAATAKRRAEEAAAKAKPASSAPRITATTVTKQGDDYAPLNRAQARAMLEKALGPKEAVPATKKPEAPPTTRKTPPPPVPPKPKSIEEEKQAALEKENKKNMSDKAIEKRLGKGYKLYTPTTQDSKVLDKASKALQENRKSSNKLSNFLKKLTGKAKITQR